jgi:hypothetical protein
LVLRNYMHLETTLYRSNKTREKDIQEQSETGHMVLQQFIFSNNSAKTILFNRKGEKVMYISYNCQRILHR